MGKHSKKKRAHKKNNSGRVTKIVHESTKEIKMDHALVENFIALQKVMVNLSGKFDSLSIQISKLLELFEISAKSLARKDFESDIYESKESKKIMEKLDNLSQQAGLIGKGLALIHESTNERFERELPGAYTPSRPLQSSPSLTIPTQRPLMQRPNIPSKQLLQPTQSKPEEKTKESSEGGQ